MPYDVSAKFIDLMTMREFYAGMAMQGLLSGPHRWEHKTARENAAYAAELAVAMADALIAELAKTKEQK